MNAQLYRVDYTVYRDFEDIVRSSYVFAATATSAVDWIKRYWRHVNDREIDLQKVQLVTPMVGKIIATTWTQS